jgi:DNA-binding NarL/FixJ family response regulator
MPRTLDLSRATIRNVPDTKHRRAFVVAEDPLWAKGIGEVVRACGFEFVDQTAAWGAIFSRIEEERPDLLVVEVGHDDLERGLALMREACAQPDGPKGIVITDEDPSLCGTVVAAGASACVGRSSDPDDLAFAIRQAFQRTAYFKSARVCPVPSDPAARAVDGLRPRGHRTAGSHACS